MSETQQSIAQWAHETFGEPASNLSIAKRADREMKELLASLEFCDRNTHAPVEGADVMIILMRLFERMGTTWQAEVDKKMAINRTRRWVIDGEGHGSHVKVDPVDHIEIEARVLGAIIARPWLIGHCEELGRDDFDDHRNRDVLAAIHAVGATSGPLPEAAIDMGLAIMRRIEGTPAAHRVDLTYVASLALIAELSLGHAAAHCRPFVLDWFDGALDDLRARRAA